MHGSGDEQSVYVTRVEVDAIRERDSRDNTHMHTHSHTKSHTHTHQPIMRAASGFSSSTLMNKKARHAMGPKQRPAGVANTNQ
jgi:hypothetical protein